MNPGVPDTPAELVIRVLQDRVEELECELAQAGTYIGALQRELIAAGVLDPELGP